MSSTLRHQRIGLSPSDRLAYEQTLGGEEAALASRATLHGMIPEPRRQVQDIMYRIR